MTRGKGHVNEAVSYYPGWTGTAGTGHRRLIMPTMQLLRRVKL